jgi:hypothetical protein
MAQGEFSEIVSRGMVRICDDFTSRAAPLGYSRTKRRLWVRENELTIESIYFHRGGGSYGGAPRNASIDIRVMLGIRVINAQSNGGVGVMSDNARRPTGYAYHHRFNAQTGSTYDRCLDELVLFVTEFAEPWFTSLRDPANLLEHAELDEPARRSLREAIDGKARAENVTASLKALGIKKSRFDRVEV